MNKFSKAMQFRQSAQQEKSHRRDDDKDFYMTKKNNKSRRVLEHQNGSTKDLQNQFYSNYYDMESGQFSGCGLVGNYWRCIAMNDASSLRPNFATAQNKTEQTDKTNYAMISNTDFMAGVFGDIVGTERPVVVGFSGNPATVAKSAWFGRPWITDKTQLSADQNNYSSFATFKPDDEGKYRRQKKQFAALYAVMLDDIGNKVPLERISLAPSWMIETSKDNYQIGFILDKPLMSAAEADQLLTAIIDAGLTDPGASGPCSRIGRLPVAINGKYCDNDGITWPRAN